MSKKRMFSMLVICAFVMSAGAAHAVCEAIAGNAACSKGICAIQQSAIKITWTDQSACGCDHIEIYVDEDCDGSYTFVTSLTDCSATQYIFCGDNGTSYRFKIVYKNGTQQTVNDIVTNCVTCGL
ncbi:MAG TPA: hypothetical protein VKU85_04445 [bacterium]|nr:hypothetical protein [bacterium]